MPIDIATFDLIEFAVCFLFHKEKCLMDMDMDINNRKMNQSKTEIASKKTGIKWIRKRMVWPMFEIYFSDLLMILTYNPWDCKVKI